MSLTLDAIAKNPALYQFTIFTSKDEKMLLRPLEPTDEKELTELIKNLSPDTKRFYSYNEPAEQIAKEHCEAINKYDKLRFVLEKEGVKEIVGLFEFSFDIPQGDIDRFEKYGIKLTSKTDCRIGPLLRDDFQSQGIGSFIVPIIVNIAKQFNRNRIILWGGVFQDNPQAIRYYEKNGFENVGEFENMDGVKCFDMMLDSV
jgi:diamine N-acetyltransferase